MLPKNENISVEKRVENYLDRALTIYLKYQDKVKEQGVIINKDTSDLLQIARIIQNEVLYG